MVNRSMGGIAAGYSGSIYNYSLNFVNPASFGYIPRATFDLGGEISRRTIKSNLSPEKYTATNTSISYLQFGVPIGSNKRAADGYFWGLSFGLRPATRINYKIIDAMRDPLIDSIGTLYEGSGGVNQASLSTAVKLKNFSVGITGGYSFGSKDYSTRRTIVNDTVAYTRSNEASNATFGGVFGTIGAQYDIKLKKGLLRLGAYGTLQHNLNAKRSSIVETFIYDGSGEPFTIDTVVYEPELKGTIVYPATYGVGFTYNNANWVFGADFETTTWSNYRFYGQNDAMQNSWRIKAGAEFYPLKDAADARKYAKIIRYRGGFYYGPDAIKVDKTRNEFGLTFGAGFPLASVSNMVNRGEFGMLNAGIEVSGRGNKESKSVREGIMRFTVGISMSARWFQKRKYD
jgi:hypothetical protein